MKKHALRSLTGVLLIILTLYSCSKNAIDTDLQHSNLKLSDFKRGDVNLQHADHVYSGCRIRQTINYQSPYTTTRRQFEYDKDNNPVRVTSDQPGTAHPDLYFKYDKKGNLMEYYGLYAGGSFFEFLHRYGYSNNRIIVDTMYIWGEYPNPTTYYTKRIRHLKYDGLERVVCDSEVYVYPSPFTNVIRYNYDNNGNLVTYGTSYDNKMSPQRTNKIWMFADRNYSVNNPAAASSYTTSGLPLSFSSSYMTFAYFGYYGSVEMMYDCIEHGKKYHLAKVK
jgi:hypothetical protein